MRLPSLQLTLAFSGALAMFGCAGTYRSPASGGAEWYEASSAHFTVRTDVGLDEARQWASECERTYAFFEEVIFPWPESPAGTTDVVLFDREDEYKEIAPRLSGGFFSKRGGPGHDPRPLIVMAAGRRTERLRRTFQHELVHRFVAFHFPGAPTWLNEGLATFYETTRFSGDRAIIGEVPYGMYFGQEIGWHTVVKGEPRLLSGLGPARVLRELSPSDFYASTIEDSAEAEDSRHLNYIAAWAHAHVLLLGPRDLYARFNDYLNALSSGREAQWNRIFDAPSNEQIEGVYRAFLSRSETSTGMLAAPPMRREHVTVRQMTPAEVHWLWAAVRPWDSKEARARARRDIDLSIQLAPQRAAGYLLRAEWWQREGNPGAARRDRLQALERESEDLAALRSWALELLSEQLEKPAQNRQWDAAAVAFSRVRVGARSAQDWLVVAIYEASRRRLDRAVDYVGKAIRRDSSCWECYLVGAELLFAKGDLDGAVRTLRLALVLAGEETNQTFRDRLREFTLAAERCKNGGQDCGPRQLTIWTRPPAKE